jgi:hypothetical protein
MKTRIAKLQNRRLLFSLLAFFIFTATAYSQPAWSRGEQLLAITFNEAMNRAEGALKAEGYVNLQSQANFVAGYKGTNTAIIMVNDMCSQTPGAKEWINIVVSSISNDGGVPGTERQNLQARMNETTTGSGAPNTPPVSNSNNKWRITATVPQGQAYPGVYTVDIELTEINGKLTGKGIWSHGATSNFTGENKNGNIVLYRTDPSGFRGTFWGKMTGSGTMEGTGQNDPSSAGGNNSTYTWTAVKL